MNLYLEKSFPQMLHLVTWSCFSISLRPLLQMMRCLCKLLFAWVPEKDSPQISQILWDASWLEQLALVYQEAKIFLVNAWFFLAKS